MGAILYSYDSSAFRKGLKRARQKRGITQEIFAKDMKVSIETVRNWEQGRNIPEIKTLEGICSYFHCSIDYLFNNIETLNHDLEFIALNTGLSEKAIMILHDCNTKAYRYIAETIELLLKYEDSKRVAGETAKRPLLAIRRFFYCTNNRLQWFPNTGRISNDGINTVFDDDLYVEDAALLHINRILNDMKKEWHNQKNQNTPHAPQ